MKQKGFPSFDLGKTDNHAQKIFDDLIHTLYGLDNLRRCMSEEEWKSFCQTKTTRFYLFKHLLSDPFTKRVYEKPRGYSCDPLAIDFLLGLKKPKISNPTGTNIFQFIYESDIAKAIRHRRMHIGMIIDDISSNSKIPISILSALAGNIREIDYSKTIMNMRYNDFTALDPDEFTIKAIDKHYSRYGIRSMLGTLNELIFQKPIGQKFNLIYSTGLIDHLDNAIAQKIVENLFDMVEGKGYLLLTNFRQSIPNTLYRTYLEAFTNWFIYYRTDEDMINLFTSIDPLEIDDFQLHTDPRCNISYLLIRKN